jgi:quercetin dioxygenase-like cupin family protein
MDAQRVGTVGAATLRSSALALSGFGLGLAVMWFAATHTHWLRFVQKRSEFHSVNPSDLAWRANGNRDRVTYYMKPLDHDDHTGEVTMLVRYPAGQINPPHTHPVGHGMYVLQGKLVTNRGTFGPGTYEWFPPDEVVWHGAGPDEDVVVIFMTHDGMSIDYMHPADH